MYTHLMGYNGLMLRCNKYALSFNVTLVSIDTKSFIICVKGNI